MSPRTDKTVVLVVGKFCESFLPFFGNHRCKERKSYTTCYDKWHMYCNLTILYGICTVMILYGACTVTILFAMVSSLRSRPCKYRRLYISMLDNVFEKIVLVN